MTSRVTRQRAQGCARDARTPALGSVARADAVGHGVTRSWSLSLVGHFSAGPSPAGFASARLSFAARFSAALSSTARPSAAGLSVAGFSASVIPTALTSTAPTSTALTSAMSYPADSQASQLEHSAPFADRAISKSLLGSYASEANEAEDDREALCLDGKRALVHSVSPHVGASALGVARPSPLRVLRDAAPGARPSPMPAARHLLASDGGRRTAPGNSCSEAFSRTSRADVRRAPEPVDEPSTPAWQCRVIPPPRAAAGHTATGGNVRESGRNSQ